ncbi:multifunctional CCA tRNA nucleotidyl transferase/2'3'-cyclic phosphodiesterase/2'nucleotidase/phosphatase [Aliidiomarina taiwanensis]|uniref:CCA-adding enzyme n=1 Tax=Aliidiomarina taiwanensis TaxID=946228 RepID=A0A432WZW0_9GAMM|nr:multifunctional CCA tRNA nucleotidyl transferase/2'3'-cyclic phosphodiesterase/2'nucleotidase/phosphatase [Aliidiomarina taiwanensis]RUO39335.1 multifunctional CCA tRNA nucleotidyl transferase/2'3'-cyclic phosphodiesterase/2'nucleotidase/phosphatase [Aliidiomarina taiwanensis]
MEIYLVGGAVRDELLGLEFDEHDYVVVGAAAEELIAQGFTPVGKDFPVFLHPETQEEYALARTERKVAAGYTGFECYAQPDVSLEDDLLRRDLTINAIAKSSSGELIDPWGGLEDIEQRVLRHVSPAFSEDPLRVLRAARFAAKLQPLGFHIAPETYTLMRELVAAGEIQHLVPERVWQETEKALNTDAPSVYFQVLHQCGALHQLLTFPLPKQGQFPLLTQVAQQTKHPLLRFAAWIADLAHPPSQTPQVLTAVAGSFKAPNAYLDIARLAGLSFDLLANSHITSTDALDFYQQCDAWRRAERFEQLHTLCLAVASSESARHRVQQLFSPVANLRTINPQAFVKQGLSGKAIGQALRTQRKQQLEDAWAGGSI